MLDPRAIRAVLPHRHPMLLVDRITALEPGRRIVGLKNVTINEPCYAHLGDDDPLECWAYPVTLMLESFGQVAGVLVNTRRRAAQASEDELMLFGAVSGMRLAGAQVYPGDTLEHEVRLERELGDKALLAGFIRAGARLVAEVERVVVAYRDRAQCRGHRP